MFKKIISLIAVMFLLVSNGHFVSGGGVYDITDGTTAFNNVRVEGTLSWQYTFATLGGRTGGGSGAQPRLEVSWPPSNTQTISVEASWNDWPAGGTISCYIPGCGSYGTRSVVNGYITPEACRVYDPPNPCPSYTWWEFYFPFHDSGQNNIPITAVPDVPNTYTFNLKAYGDGLLNSEFSTISNDGGSSAPYECNWFYTGSGATGSQHPGVGGCPSDCYWGAGIYDCRFANPNLCLDGSGGNVAGWEKDCNGVYALVQFFDNSNPLLSGALSYESDNWASLGDSPLTYTYNDGVTYRTDSAPGANVEFQRAITISVDCEDECNFGTPCCTLAADGCYDSVCDCGLKIQDEDPASYGPTVIACAPEGASGLKIRGSDGTIYNVVLVPTTDACRSKARVQTSSGTMALRKLNC